jgi:hypothetical protein
LLPTVTATLAQFSGTDKQPDSRSSTELAKLANLAVTREYRHSRHAVPTHRTESLHSTYGNKHLVSGAGSVTQSRKEQNRAEQSRARDSGAAEMRVRS